MLATSRLLLAAALLATLATATLARMQYSNTKMLCLVNKERRRNGLKPLGLDPKLTKAAQRHSDDQARRRKMSHNGSDGSSPSTRVSRAGFNWKSVAENVAYGYNDEEECMEQWMASSGHRKNILGSSYTMFGSAVAYNGDTPYFTQDFASDGKPARNIPKCDGSDRDYEDSGSDDYGDDYGSRGGDDYGDDYGSRGGDDYGDNYGDDYGSRGGDNYGDDYGSRSGDDYGDDYGGHDNSDYGSRGDDYGSRRRDYRRPRGRDNDRDSDYGDYDNSDYGDYDNSDHGNRGGDDYGSRRHRGGDDEDCEDGKRDGRHSGGRRSHGGNDYPMHGGRNRDHRGSGDRRAY